jgi:hypothetical protein
VLRVVAVGLTLGLGALCGCGSDTVVRPAPNQREFQTVGGENQAAFIGHPVPLPLNVMVKNADGSVAPHINIDWAVKTGGGTLSAATSATDDRGVASVNWTLGYALGIQSVTASAPGLSVSPLTFSATGRPLPMVLQNTGGSRWNLTLVDTTNVSAVLTSIWGAGPSNVFAVGKCQDVPLSMRYNGSVWTVPVSCPAGTPAGFAFIHRYTSVWGNSASDVFAVRQYRRTMSSMAAIDHFDGQSWTQTYIRQCSGQCGLAVRAVWTGAVGSAIAVGDSGTILRYNGASWDSEPSSTTAHLTAIWGAGASGPVFAVGDAGTILINNGVGWTAQTSGTTQPLYAVWGTSGSDVFAVGGAGTILHYNGTWTAQSSGSTESLRGLWGSSSSSVFAVGDATTILRYDGSSWSAETVDPFTNPSMNLTGVWGISPSNIIAVGQPN